MNFAINHEHIREMERNRFLYSELFFFFNSRSFLEFGFYGQDFSKIFYITIPWL